MPINIPNGLPAKAILESEKIFALEEDIAKKQDIRPLKVAILNLMPKKIETETQILRLISKSPLQVDIDFMKVSSHRSKNTSADHLVKFYDNFDVLRRNYYDGLIITGAPVEHLPYEEVDYWEELCEIMEWSRTNVYSTMHICWGAQAGLYYHYGIDKYLLPEKLSGIFKHKVLNPLHPLTRGFDDRFYAPHSRYTSIHREDIDKNPNLITLSVSNMAGVYLVASKSGRQVFVTGHAEYDRDTLANEYFRDVKKGIHPKIPVNYFPDDDVETTPYFTWKSHAHLLFANWLNYYVYQQTPFDLKDLKCVDDE